MKKNPEMGARGDVTVIKYGLSPSTVGGSGSLAEDLEVGAPGLAGEPAAGPVEVVTAPERPLPAVHRRPGGWLQRYRRRAVLMDLVAAVCGGTGACAWRSGTELTLRYVLICALTALAWLPVVYLARGYERRLLGGGTEEYRALIRAAVWLLATIGFLAFVLRPELPRGYVLGIMPVSLTVSLFLRHRLRAWLGAERAAGRCLQRTVVIGREDSAGELIREVHGARAHTLQIVAVCASTRGVPRGRLPESIEGVEVVGTPAEVLSAVDACDAEVVAVASQADLSGHALRQLSWELEDRQVDLVVSPGIFEVAGPRLSIRPEAGVSLLHVERPVSSGAKVLLKRTMDRGLSMVLTLCALPVLVGVALAIRFTSPGPVLFRQVRVGERGRLFHIYKFRTMVVDAEARLAEVGGGHEVNEVLFKQKRDPRITQVGAVLRRLSIDELPQLINVLKGDMSLVGPRPPLPSEVSKYESDAMRRLRVQPGMTGLWQVSGRSDLTWQQSLRLDLWYVDNWSPLLDLQILWRTGRAVVKGTGAY
jgi:exopolysaccharide biosynthesis polyprenyl glycosylphosphotransferase